MHEHDLAGAHTAAVDRAAIRAGEHTGPTSGLAPGFAQANLVILPADIVGHWRTDLVSLLLGCSFTFEWALTAAGLPLAHQAQRVNVPMYVTDRRHDDFDSPGAA